ncbi:MAG: hypothetical protein CJBNEKGG_03694 [Prosthecobacter sp.]|nr:hypothetical protein [Prosthecobacter sp.]
MDACSSNLIMAEVRCLISRKNYRQNLAADIPVTDGTLNLRFTAEQGEPLLCGLEILRDGLKPGKLPER